MSYIKTKDVKFDIDDSIVKEMIEKIDRLFSIAQNLTERIKRLEDISHPKRDFVICKKCNEGIEEDK